MMTVARSKDIWGPYESNSINPILTAGGDNGHIQHTGQCDMFQSDNGGWWGVCLSVRKDVRGRYNMGQETFLASGSWPEGEWPSLNRVELNPKTLPQITSSGLDIVPASPLSEFVHIHDAELDKYKVLDQGGSIFLEASLIDLSESFGSPTFTGKRQRQIDGKSEVVILTTGAQTEHIKAGLLCYKNQQRFFRISYDTSETAVVFEVWNNTDKIHRTALHKLDTAPPTV
ncbi:hypothetical protein ACEPPN_005177 [Leptodophora sp. 'Broadleaf-Isolate-01']